jgi:hypothetical protein
MFTKLLVMSFFWNLIYNCNYIFQEVEPTVGEALCRLFPPDENIDLRRIAQIARQSLRRKEGGSTTGKSSSTSVSRSVTDSASYNVADESSSRSDMLMLGLYRELMSASDVGCCLSVGADDGDRTTSGTKKTSYFPDRCRTLFLGACRDFGLNSEVSVFRERLKMF